MKQTNNAIKFLMAQYRAIFRNANLKMFLAAATAAAAMAAGSAQAAKQDDLVNDDLSSVTSGVIEVVGDTATAEQYKKITLTGGAALPPTAKDVTIKITGSDASTIKGGDGAPKVDLTGAKLSFEGATGSAVNTKLVIGVADKPTEVLASELSITKGTLELSAADDVANKNSFSADDITIGSGDAADAALTLGKNAIVTANESIVVNKGAAVKLGEAAAISGQNAVVNSGSVTLGDKAKIDTSEITVAGGSVVLSGSDADKAGILGSAASTIEITSGEVKSDTAKHGALIGKKITLSGKDSKLTNSEGLTITAGEGGFTATGGTISTADGKTITFVGDTKLKSGTSLTITGSGSAAFKGKATIEDDVKLTLGDKAKTIIAADADHSSSVLNVSKATFGKLVEGDNRKITAQTAATGQTAELHFTDADEINLASGGVGVLNDDGSGLLDKNFEAINGDGVFKVSADKVAFEKASLAVDKLTIAGNEVKVGTGDSFILSGSNLEVGHKLTVVDGSKALKIEKGSVFLTDEKNQKGNTIAAKSIVIGKNGSNKGNLNVTAGEWSVSGVDLKFGAVNANFQKVVQIHS